MTLSVPATILTLTLAFGLSSMPVAWAGPPTEQLRDGIERIYKTLGEDSMAGDEKAIDGISLVANYRAQFNKIIRTSSYEGLVTKFKSNQTEFSGPAPAALGRKSSQ